MARSARPKVITRTLPLLTLFFVASCAQKMTLAQEITWDAFKACEAEGPATNLERVLPDGRWYILGRENLTKRVNDCMMRYWSEGPASRLRPPPRAQSAPPSTASATSTTLEKTAASLDGVMMPLWKKGDERAYRWESPSSKGTQVEVIAREELVGGVKHFVMTAGNREAYYRESDLALTLQKLDGEVERKISPGWVRYKWPLRVGMTWEQTVVNDRPKLRATQETTYACSVGGPEKVIVPAGEFDTLKVECRNAKTGSLLIESWYSPDVMWYVRNRVRATGGFTEWQLIGYQRK